MRRSERALKHVILSVLTAALIGMVACYVLLSS
jgi:hypothetical protein